MGNIFKNLRGTTSPTFSVGKPSNPERVIGLIAWDKYDTQLDVNNTALQLYKEATFYLPEGLYRVGYQYFWGYSSASADIIIQCNFNNVEVSYQRQEPKDAGTNQRYPTTIFDYVEVTTEGDYVMDIKVACQASNQTARMYRSVMEIWRVL